MNGVRKALRHTLVAFFEDRAQRGGEDTSPARLNFFLIGLGGTVLALVGFDLAWRKRFRAVRRPLVKGAELKRGER